MPTTETEPILELEDLTVAFDVAGGRFQAVRGVTQTLRPRESIAIIGESGSGKTVTAHAILDLIRPPGRICSGNVRFKGRDCLAMSKRERRALFGKGIAAIFQDPQKHLNPVLPVGWQIAEVLRIHGVSRREANRRALELMERVGIPDPVARRHDFPHEFSGGQRQRIMIAMAIALNPEVLIADEPTTALDVTIQAQILELLRKIQHEDGMSLIIITHDLGVAADISEQVLVMKNGCFVERGYTNTVFKVPQHPYTKALLAARQRKRSSFYEPISHRPLLRVDAVEINYGPVKAVAGISLEILAGEIVCIVGELGSGKSTLASAILGLRPPNQGKIRFHSKNLSDLDRDEMREFRRSVQAVFQDPFSSLNPQMNVRSIICEGWAIHRGLLDKDKWTERATALVERVGLRPGDLYRYPSQFSGGQQQRIAIARALALEPKLLVCDEAVSSLDMSIQAQVIELLEEIRDRIGLAIIFISHDLDLVRSFADRVIVMRNGVVVEEGTPETLFGKPRTDYTKLLIASSPAPNPEQQADRRRQLAALTMSWQQASLA